MQQCYFLMQQALDADEADLKDLALQLYTQAVELAVSVVSIYVQYYTNCSLLYTVKSLCCGFELFVVESLSPGVAPR